MKVGVTVGASNDLDVERIDAGDWSRPPSVPDHQIWHNSIALGELIEPLGFDSIWVTEHLASPYGMTPNTLQVLAFWAGRTRRVDVGTMVVIAPWWDPVRLAHEIAMLDILLTGRNYTVGLGRGLSPKEYGALRIPQDESRQRFDETLEILHLALTKERFSYDGKIFQIPEMSVRPQAQHRDMVSNAVGAFMTASSLEAVARAGLGHIVVAGQSTDQVAADSLRFNAIRADLNLPPIRPIIHLSGVYCRETEAEAKKGLEYIDRSVDMTNWHYGFSGKNATDFSKIPGYEAYSKMGDLPGSKPPNAIVGEDVMVGTPDQLIEKITRLQHKTGCREVVVAFSVVGSTPREEVEQSMRLFAEKVLPAIHAIRVGESEPAALASGVA